MLYLFPISPVGASKVFPKEYTIAMAEMEDVNPGDLDWYVDNCGNLWTNDAYESHGNTFFNITCAVECSAADVEVFYTLPDEDE